MEFGIKRTESFLIHIIYIFELISMGTNDLCPVCNTRFYGQNLLYGLVIRPFLELPAPLQFAIAFFGSWPFAFAIVAWMSKNRERLSDQVGMADNP